MIIAKYLLVWLLLAVVAVLNGTVREFTYGKIIPELAAHQVSTVTAIAASGAVVWLVHRYWPIKTSGQAWAIGLLWLFITVAFEFGFGHFIAGHSWERLLADYNLLNGRVWAVFLAWIAVMPIVIFRISRRAT